MLERWVVCVRDGTTGEDLIVGPFRNYERASDYNRRVNKQAPRLQGEFDDEPELIGVIEPLYAQRDVSPRRALVGPPSEPEQP